MFGYKTQKFVFKGITFKGKHIVESQSEAKDHPFQEQLEASCLDIPNLLSGTLYSPTA